MNPFKTIDDEKLKKSIRFVEEHYEGLSDDAFDAQLLITLRLVLAERHGNFDAVALQVVR